MSIISAQMINIGLQLFDAYIKHFSMKECMIYHIANILLNIIILQLLHLLPKYILTFFPNMGFAA